MKAVALTPPPGAVWATANPANGDVVVEPLVICTPAALKKSIPPSVAPASGKYGGGAGTAVAAAPLGPASRTPKVVMLLTRAKTRPATAWRPRRLIVMADKPSNSPIAACTCDGGLPERPAVHGRTTAPGTPG